MNTDAMTKTPRPITRAWDPVVHQRQDERCRAERLKQSDHQPAPVAQRPQIVQVAVVQADLENAGNQACPPQHAAVQVKERLRRTKADQRGACDSRDDEHVLDHDERQRAQTERPVKEGLHDDQAFAGSFEP